MSEYIRKTWVPGEEIASAALNNIETGIVEGKKAAEDARVAAYNHAKRHGSTGADPITPQMIGAAPSGYGLGDIAYNCPVMDDAHKALGTGWYRMTADTLNGIAQNAICRVESFNANVRILTAFTTQASNLYYVVRRKVCFNSVWGDWEWHDPPLLLGIEYLTTERYLGKAVYAKLVNFGALPAATTKSVSFTDASGATVVYCALHLSDGAFIVGEGTDRNVTITTITVHPSRTAVSVITTVDLSAVTAYALVKYTKD